MATIDVTDYKAPSIIVLEAMTDKANKSDLLEVFKVTAGTPKVEVTMFINGVEVDVVSTLNDAWDRLESNFDKHVVNKAVELVSSAKLDKLKDALDYAEWTIKQALEDAVKYK